MLRSSTPWFFVLFGHSDPLVHGAQARHTRAEPDGCVGQAAETPGAGGTVAAALPSGRRAAHGAFDRRCRSTVADACIPAGRWHDTLTWACAEGRRAGAGEEGGGHGTTGGGEPLRTVRRGLAAWPRDRGAPDDLEFGAAQRSLAGLDKASRLSTAWSPAARWASTPWRPRRSGRSARRSSARRPPWSA